MKTGQRWLILGALLIATVGAAAWVRNGEDTEPAIIAAATARREPAGSPAATAQPDTARPASPARTRYDEPRINLDKLKARSPGELVRDPFAVPAPKPERNTRAKTRAPSTAALPPPQPIAPPLPFTYMGKLRSGADTAVFLNQGDRNLVLREGDIIDSVYRVEHIADSEITLVYLPLSQRQTIPIGEPQ